MNMTQKNVTENFFNDFFQNFSIDKVGGFENTEIRDAEIPAAENNEMVFSTEDLEFQFPDQEIPTDFLQKEEPAIGIENDVPNDVHSLEEPAEEQDFMEMSDQEVQDAAKPFTADLLEKKDKEEQKDEEPSFKLRQFPKQIQEQAMSEDNSKDDLSEEEPAEEQDFMEMSDQEVQDATKPFTIDLLEQTVENMDFSEDYSEEAHRFVISDDLCADWAIEKIHKEYEEFQRIKELAEARMQVIKERLEKEERRYTNATKYFKSLLQEYFLKVPKKVTKTQETYNLLNGKLVMKKASTNYERDEKAVLEFLKENNLAQFIKTKETLNWEALKKQIETDGDSVVLKETGECIEGVSVKEVPAKFDVKFLD